LLPRYASREIKRGTLNGILKQLGLELKEGNNTVANSGTHRCRRTRLSRFKFSCSAKP
jgi:hypothetical protein